MPLPTAGYPILNRKSAKEIVYDFIRKCIIDGTLAPGEKIIDSEIASLFSVSRTPVREAILALESQKLVKITPGRGTTVSHFDMTSIKTLYEAIISIETSALSIAFLMINDEVIKELKEINNRFLSSADSNDLERIRAIDNEFHQVFFNIANNTYLNSFHSQLKIHTTRVENIFFRRYEEVEKSYSVHEQLIKYLEERDLENARIMLALNWMNILNVQSSLKKN